MPPVVLLPRVFRATIIMMVPMEIGRANCSPT